jgi:hypothetical protein
MATERTLDIFNLLSEIDRKNYDLWDTLSENQRKEFSALVTMRWMAGTTDQRQLIFLNEIVNTSVFNIGEHKEFLLKLLTVCASGEKKRYNWINYKLGNGSKKTKLSIGLIMTHYRLSAKEAEDVVKLLSPVELMELGEMQGWQKQELKDLKKEVGA